jgi:hypothetical protein
MQRWGVFGVVPLAALALAAPATAQDGGGLYEPFPEPASTGQVRDFLGQLPGGQSLQGRVTNRELERGVFPSGALPATNGAGDASRRAAVSPSPGFLEGWLPALAVLVVVAGLGWVAVRRTQAASGESPPS